MFMTLTTSGPSSGAFHFSAPVPEQDELLTKEQAKSWIRKNITELPPDEPGFSLVRFDKLTSNLKYILYTTLEGDKTCGRAIAATPLNTALALGAYELLDEPTLKQIHTNNAFTPAYFDIADDEDEDEDDDEDDEDDEDEPTILSPQNIIEFSYDFRPTSGRRPIVTIASIPPENYLFAVEDLPESWFPLLNRSPDPPFFRGEPVVKDVNIQKKYGICGDPVDERYRKVFPASHPVRFRIRPELDKQVLKRTIKNMIRLAAKRDERIIMTLTANLVQFNWSQAASLDQNFLMSIMPRLMSEAIATILPYRIEDIVLDILRPGDDNPFFGLDPVKRNAELDRQTHTIANWKHFRETIDRLTPLLGTTTEGNAKLLFLLLYYLGCGKNLNTGDRKLVSKKTIVGYIRSFLAKNGHTTELKDRVFFTIFQRLDDPYDAFSILDQPIFDIKQKTNNASRLMEQSPELCGFMEFFGRDIDLGLTHDWYMHLDPQGSFSANVLRKTFTDLLTLVGHFTVKKDEVRSGDRLNLARTLIHTESEELIQRALQSELTTRADLRRALRSFMDRGIQTPLIPYLIYVTKGDNHYEKTN